MILIHQYSLRNIYQYSIFLCFLYLVNFKSFDFKTDKLSLDISVNINFPPFLATSIAAEVPPTLQQRLLLIQLLNSTKTN